MDRDLLNWMIDIRRDFHMYPELGTYENRTASRIEEILESLSIPYKRVADTGVVAYIKGEDSGPVIGVRADIDALPITEVEGRTYGSKNKGVMHACGHDVHATIALGLGRELVKIKDTLKGEVRLLFQPAEETVGGAERMVECGVMDGVDYTIGLHVMPYLETGQVELKYGKLNASSDTIKITINGTSSHGAYPHTGIDAIVIASHVVTSLQTLVSRTTSPHESVVFSLGTINGGTRGNIIADKVELIGTLRTTNEDVRKASKERIRSIVEEIPKGFGGSGTLTIELGYMSLTNTDSVVEVIEENSTHLLGKENIKYKELPSLGVEDFSFFIDASKYGGAYFHLGCGNKEKGIISPAHNESFDVDEDCMEVGVKLQLKNILSLLEKGRK